MICEYCGLPTGRLEITTGTGTAHPECMALIIAFVQGAQWWEFHKTGGTMWNSDRNLAEEEAKTKMIKKTLGMIRLTKKGD